MMNIESKSKWQLRFATLSIFAIGFVAGVLALNAFNLWFGNGNRQSRREKYEAMFSELGLNENQKTDVERIFGETRENIQKMRQESEPRIQEIRARNDEKLRNVLTPEQWEAFEKEREKIRESDKPPTPKPLDIK
jgi:Spy/CpxP family protein refolding chaperone